MRRKTSRELGRDGTVKEEKDKTQKGEEKRGEKRRKEDLHRHLYHHHHHYHIHIHNHNHHLTSKPYSLLFIRHSIQGLLWRPSPWAVSLAHPHVFAVSLSFRVFRQVGEHFSVLFEKKRRWLPGARYVRSGG